MFWHLGRKAAGVDAEIDDVPARAAVPALYRFWKPFMVHRGVKYEIVRDCDVHPCWRWAFVVGNRRRAGQTKISLRAAEIQARQAIDKALRPKGAGPRGSSAIHGISLDTIVEKFSQAGQLGNAIRQ